MQRPGWLHHPACKTSASLLLAFFLLWCGARFYLKAFHGFAWDFSINWVAAQGWQQGLSVYDRQALQQLAVARIGEGAGALFAGRFTSFVGLPTTAMFHLPFTLLPFDAAVLWYRLLALAAMLLAVVLAGLALPVAQRRVAWGAGVLCLASWQAFPQSLQLGQVDAWVMLALAGAMLAASRERWAMAGIAIGLAALLKISPGWLLLACLLQRQWAVLWAAALTLLAGLGLSALSPHGDELREFFTRVLPSLGDSPLHVQNQSLGAWLARLATPDVHLLNFAAGMGGWKLVALGVSLLLLAGVRHRQPVGGVTPGLLALVILPALLAGPLTWDHYLAWAVLPVMWLAAQLSWAGRWVLALVLLPLLWPVPYVQAAEVAAHGGWRVVTGLHCLSLLAVAGLVMASGHLTGRRYDALSDHEQQQHGHQQDQ